METGVIKPLASWREIISANDGRISAEIINRITSAIKGKRNSDTEVRVELPNARQWLVTFAETVWDWEDRQAAAAEGAK